jgi:hypothetical protein
MMLHRHFEAEKNKNVTTLEDVTPKPTKQDEFVSEIFPPEEPTKRRGGRPKKTDESKE